MRFEEKEMVTEGAYDNFYIKKIKGVFNGWNIAILSNISEGTNILNLKDEKTTDNLMAIINDFVKSKEILESQSDGELRVEVETLDGLVLGGEGRKIDEILKKNYGRGLW